MKNQMIDNNYYTSRKSQLLRDFDKIAKRVRKVLVSCYGDHFADTIARESRREYEALIPQLPYIGGKKNPFTDFVILSGQSLALYKALKKHTKTVDEANAMLWEVFKAVIDTTPKLLGWLYGKWIFTKYYVNRLRKMAAESQKREYPGGYVFTFVEGDGEEFDYGLDFTECATCKFYDAQGESDFTPLACAADYLKSKAFGWGLTRTMTLAEGYEKCAFRHKKGDATRVTLPDSLKRIILENES